MEPTEEGDYEICFDNSFSRVTKKTVFFEIIVDTMEENDLDADENWKKFVTEDETYGDKLTSLEVRFCRLENTNIRFKLVENCWKI